MKEECCTTLVCAPQTETLWWDVITYDSLVEMLEKMTLVNEKLQRERDGERRKRIDIYRERGGEDKCIYSFTAMFLYYYFFGIYINYYLYETKTFFTISTKVPWKKISLFGKKGYHMKKMVKPCQRKTIITKRFKNLRIY